MVEFLKTLAIACIPAIITGIVTYIVARKNAASQISMEIRFNGEIESLDDFQRSSIAQYLF